MGLLVLKGLLDNVLSDYLWARAVLLTSPTVATCGTTIQARTAQINSTPCCSRGDQRQRSLSLLALRSRRSEPRRIED